LNRINNWIVSFVSLLQCTINNNTDILIKYTIIKQKIGWSRFVYVKKIEICNGRCTFKKVIR